MTPFSIEAPGKLMLFGEYAVLHGAPALVAAVDRRARCDVTESPVLNVDGGTHGRLVDGTLPFATALVQPDDGPALFTLCSDVFQDTQSGEKLGLGSSAATTVALAGALEVAAGRPLDARAVYVRAQTAHRAVQRTGSGADIAASAFGGLLRYTWSRFGELRAGDGAGSAKSIPPPPRLLVAYTGRPASTRALVRRVRALETRDPSVYNARIETLGALTESAIACGLAGHRLVELVRGGAETLAALGQDAGVDLVLDSHRKLNDLCARFGGGAKPTGAGGGDLAWMVAPDEEAEEAMANAASGAGFAPFYLDVSREGVRQVLD